jgi:DNA polymerase III epsilon subunit-like protein
MKLLIFDTETTGLPKTREPAIKGSDNWPHLVSIAWTVIDSNNNYECCALSESYIVKPQWSIPEDSTKIHGITQAKAEAEGIPLSTIISKFLAIEHDIMIAHNMNFDYNVLVNAIMWDLKLTVLPDFKPKFCSMEAMKNIMQIPYANGRGYKPPKLTELYTYVVKKPFDSGKTHSAQYDTWLLADIIKNSKLLQSMMGLNAVPVPNPNASKKARTTLIL